MENVEMDVISAATPAQQHEATHSLVNAHDDDSKQGLSIKSPKDLWIWFANDPFSRWPFVIFLAGIPFGCIMLIVTAADVKDSYVPAGIGCLIICFFGSYHFKELMALKAEVDTFRKLNHEFRSQTHQLSHEVNRLESATRELAHSKDSLFQANIHNKQCLEKFGKIQNNLSIMGENSASGMNKIAEMASEMQKKWKKDLVQNQRSIFSTVFNEMEFGENEEGMTEAEYKQFLEALPTAYARHLQTKISFKDIARSDGIIDVDEFCQILDQIEDGTVISLKDGIRGPNDVQITETKQDDQ